MKNQKATVWLVALGLTCLLAACSDEGAVRAKRTKPGNVGITKFYLCLGGTDASDCRWIRVPAGKTDKEWYDRCAVGDAYPDCRAAFGRRCEHSCT